MHTAWDVSTAVYENKFCFIKDETSVPESVTFKTDGAKMYVMGGENRNIFQYTLSTPWDVSTGYYDARSKYVGDEDSTPTGASFKPDGTKMYFLGTFTDTIFQYSLSSPWNIDSASYDNVYKDISSETSYHRGLFFKPDGLGVYTVDCTNRMIYQYTLSVAWVISSAFYTDKSFSVISEDGDPRDLSFKTDGTKMYIMGFGTKKVHQYSLSNPWSIDSASYEDKYKYIYDQEWYPVKIYFKTDGTKMYMAGSWADTVFQYDLPVGETFYQSVGGSFGFTGALIKSTTKTLAGSLTFLGSIFLGRFLQATLSISCNESELSAYSNESALSIYENESILSIEE